tara:strand:+ start:284 stop:1015 length:732 start_codon:yes stop_codon:yes gene_type:complete
MTFSALIPARLNSTRLKRKLLKKINGIPLIVRTYQNIKSFNFFDNVTVVTESEEIIKTLKEFNINFLKSKKKHLTGTDRIAEFANDIISDFVINVQGDEPFIEKDDLKKVIDEFKKDKQKKIDVVSLMSRINVKKQIIDPNNVKVVVDKNNDSIIFTRSVIPYQRSDINPIFYKHVGIYGFRKSFLKDFSKFEQTPLEKSEKIEALRMVENGKKIRMIEIFNEHISIDTPEDLKRAKLLFNLK